MGKKHDNDKNPVAPRDGFDNTGTQGYDSLTDDAYTGSSKKPLAHPDETESGTGSSSEDFPDLDPQKDQD